MEKVMYDVINQLDCIDTMVKRTQTVVIKEM